MNSFNISLKNPTIFVALVICLIAMTTQSCTTDDTAVDPTPKNEEPSSLRVGLSGHWDFLGNANDLSKYGNDGAVNGATPAKDRFGNPNSAFRFDGENDYIDFGNITFLSWGGYDRYTIAAWVKPGQDGGAIVSKWNGGVRAGWYLDITDEMYARTYRNVTPWATSSIDKVEAGDWYHMVAMYDGSDLFIYVNGELQAQQEFRSHTQDFDTPVLIGAKHSQNYPADFFTGVIDEVRLYSRDLSAEEIEWLANN